MEIEKILESDFLNRISFFNFENAITAAFYTDENLNLVNANTNFENLFKKGIEIKSQNLLTLLANLGVEQEIISDFRTTLNTDGKVLIPQIKIMLNGELRYFSLLSTKTKSPFTKILNGIQGQLIDRTAETILKQENEKLISLNQEAYDSLKDKNAKLEKISNRLAKYLSPQIYKNIFESDSEHTNEYKRKKLTVFFSDIKGFTDLSDSLDPDLLAELVNDYLSAMTDIALKHGGTIDKFIGDAILVFFGDPESDGLKKDASKCLSMAIAMQNKVAELDKSWREDHGIAEGLKVRIGISTGYCTVGNFGSVQRVDYTVLGSTVNLASRLESICQPQKILVAPETKVLLEKDFKFRAQESVSLKGFNQPVVPYEYINLKETTSPEILKGNVVDIILKQPKDIESILLELKSLQKDYEGKLKKTRSSKKKKK
ncbi:MAG: adenylate/guanylate cyclase domain-containing protein [Rhodobacterales bacterium]|nr:adenylate/guanylate cyclase domain-containing protein [Rhodobacterales bacterium]